MSRFSTARVGKDGSIWSIVLLYWAWEDRDVPLWEFRVFYLELGIKTELFRLILQGLGKLEQFRPALGKSPYDIVPSYNAATHGSWEKHASQRLTTPLGPSKSPNNQHTHIAHIACRLVSHTMIDWRLSTPRVLPHHA
eukprot:6176080-Amphidinium_carterae.1